MRHTKGKGPKPHRRIASETPAAMRGRSSPALQGGAAWEAQNCERLRAAASVILRASDPSRSCGSPEACKPGRSPAANVWDSSRDDRSGMPVRLCRPPRCFELESFVRYSGMIVLLAAELKIARLVHYSTELNVRGSVLQLIVGYPRIAAKSFEPSILDDWSFHTLYLHR